MAPVIEFLRRWGMDYEERRRYEFAGGVIIPKVNIGAIEGGLPYKPNYSPAVCSVYLDVRIPPGVEPQQIKTELEEKLRGQGFDATVSMYRSNKGYEPNFKTIN